MSPQWRSGLNKAENIHLVLERNGVKRGVYVGDTAGDMRSARAAGVPFIFARYGFGHADDAEYVIDDIRELPGIIGRL